MKLPALILLPALLLVAGCSHDSSTPPASQPTTQTVQERWYCYDDPRFSPDQRQAVRVAAEAVVDPKAPRPDLTKAFRYQVQASRVSGDWVVTVWRVSLSKGFDPQLVPGGFTVVILGPDFKVRSTLPGE